MDESRVLKEGSRTKEVGVATPVWCDISKKRRGESYKMLAQAGQWVGS